MKIVAVVLALLPLAASAATITVNTAADKTVIGDGKCTLREAIANVNAAADTTSGDCVAGTGSGDAITFTLSRPATIGLTLGQLTIQADVTITGPPAMPVTISGAHQTRVFEIAAGTARMSGVTVQFGMADHGAGILVDSGAAVDLDTCTLKQNTATASGGGGLYNSGSAALTNCKLKSNASTGDGGGLLNLGTITLTNCAFGANRTRSGGNGGGVNNSGAATLTSCTFRGNRAVSTAQRGAAGNGGGLYNSGTANVTGCTFTGNSARLGVGGGILSGASITVTNCAFNGNSAWEGGGLAGGGMTLANSTISANSALILGGGIFADGGTLTNCTISGNRVAGLYGTGQGGGVWNGDHKLQLTSCTVSGNRSPVAGADLFYAVFPGGIIYLGNTIVAGKGTKGNCASREQPGYFIATSPNLDSDGSCFGGARVDPILAPLNDYGGPTRTIALCTGPGAPVRSCAAASPAIDAGDDSVIGPPDNLTTDQRGLPRLSGAHVDIGAYEVQQ